MCVLSKAQLNWTTVMYKQRERELVASGVPLEEAKTQAAVWIQAYRRELLSTKKRRLSK